MSPMSWWKRSMMLLGAGAAGLAGLLANPERGAVAEPPVPMQDADGFLYRGSATCERCHNIKDNPLYKPSIGFIQLDEFKTWKEKDKHSLAYSNLLSPRGKQMASLLKIEDLTSVKAGCVGCHGAGEAEAKDRTEGDVFSATDGVSCENCHGPSSKWWAPHADTSFRKFTPEAREKLGLVDLRSPVRQADRCLSCHIGNADEGKVVTHDMYFAGHPPLPSIEVSTFSDNIPRHWWLPSEKPSAKMQQQAGFKPGEKERTRMAMVGAAVALKTSMKLLADETRADGSTTVPGLDWPDYARFDCWSCHHDLKRDGWRQARGFQASPGRPPISEWPRAIVELGIDRLEVNNPAAGALRNELKAHRDAVLAESNGKPYGRKVPMAQAAEAFAKWADVLIRQLAGASYTDGVALQLLRKLVARAEEKVSDYDEARHIGWTIRVLVHDAGPKLSGRDDVKAVLAKLAKGLKLELPAGRDYQIEDQLGTALQVIGDYDPADFRAHVKELAGLLPPS